MSENIPFEIQAEILKRMPLKPLLQFRTVSKSYKCLIDSPNFSISYYVHHHPQQSHDRFIFRYVFPHPSVEDKYITFVDNDDSFVRQEFIPPVPDLMWQMKPSSYVVGSSYGLLCFMCYYHVTKMVVLWNPSIRKSVGIQVPYVSECPNEIFRDLRVDNVFGFVVCPVTFDPTILKITCIDYMRKRDDASRVITPWKVRVFTLSTGTWSILSTNLPRDSIRLRGSQVVIDRFIYWVAQDMLDAEEVPSQSRFLMMFDLTAKEFKEIYLIDSLANRPFSVQTISKLQESLVLLEYHRESEQDPSVYGLWMMKEQGVSRSFTKLYTINLPDASISQILGFRKTSELIMETRHNVRSSNLQIYEPNNEYAENLGIDGKNNSFFMCPYMESLLLLDKSDGYIYPPTVLHQGGTCLV